MRQIAKDLYHLPLMPRNSINCYVAEGHLIDAGIKSSSGKILKNIGDKDVHSHVLTHAHADHQGSSSSVCKALNIPLICSDKEKPQAESGDATKEYRSKTNIIVRFQKKYWAGDGHLVSKTIKENDRIGNFIVIETPGHSSGHLSFFRESDGVLIVGDVATNMNLLTTVPGLHLPPDLFTLEKEENIKSLKKLASLHPKIICFGHGPILENDRGQFQEFARKI